MNKEKIITLLSEVLSRSPSELMNLPQTTSLPDLGLSSLLFVKFVVMVEAEFSIEIKDSDLLISKFETLEALFDTLNNYFSRPTSLKKVLVCDCDNVLWRGIAGEEPLVIKQNIFLFQKTLLYFYNSGVLLCLCSKNEQANIDEAFKTLDMPIRQEHFIASRINRNNKAANINELAAELNLAIDSFVFVDDSEYELGLVKALCPEVESVKADYSDLSFTARLSSYFETSQPNNRNTLYLEQKNREKLKLRALSVTEYNRSLDTKSSCFIATGEEAGRFAELSQRTNQFNLSDHRYTEDEIKDLINKDSNLVLALRASDKFGDMGIVGGAVVKLYSSGIAVIESFFLSCRVFDRDFEITLLNSIKEKCNTQAIYGFYRPNDKNARYSSFYSENEVMSYDGQPTHS